MVLGHGSAALNQGTYICDVQATWDKFSACERKQCIYAVRTLRLIASCLCTCFDSLPQLTAAGPDSQCSC